MADIQGPTGPEITDVGLETETETKSDAFSKIEEILNKDNLMLSLLFASLGYLFL